MVWTGEWVIHMASKALAPIVDVVSVLVRSQELETYRVGITKDSSRRRNQYKNYSVPKPWPHMVFLAFDLPLAKAQTLEKSLFETCTNGDRRSPLYKKYDSSVRDQAYVKSAGGKPSTDDARYCLYVVWCNK